MPINIKRKAGHGVYNPALSKQTKVDEFKVRLVYIASCRPVF